MSQSVSVDTFEGRSTSQRVISAVAETKGVEPTEVDPLYDVIEPDALDRLFAANSRNGRSTGFVEFTFAGCEVRVRADGDVDVTEREISVDAGDGVESETTRAQSN